MAHCLLRTPRAATPLKKEKTMDEIDRLEMLGRLGSAALLGALVGWERSQRDHPAGMRTQIVISTGAAALIVLSLTFEPADAKGFDLDPLRVLQGIVQGIGLLAGGAIIQAGGSVKGLTTASSVWAVAAVGAACGFGEFFLASVLALITLFTTGLLIHLDPKKNDRKQPSSDAS
jgi:putative Mg2+ transporter-C (MgtC) family protein